MCDSLHALPTNRTLATPKPYRNPSRLFGHPNHPIKDIRNDEP